VLEHHQACSGKLVGFIGKFTVLVQEKLVLLRQKVRHDFNQVVVFVLVNHVLSSKAPVHKNVTLAGMAVEVAKQHHLVFLVTGGNQLLREINCWVQ